MRKNTGYNIKFVLLFQRLIMLRDAIQVLFSETRFFAKLEIRKQLL